MLTMIDTYENLMEKGHATLEVPHLMDEAIEIFQEAASMATSGDQLSEALRMEAVAHFQLGDPQEAERVLQDSLTHKASAVQQGKVLRDLGVLSLATARKLTDQRAQEDAFDEAEVQLQKSYDILSADHSDAQMAITLWFQGQLAESRGDVKPGQATMELARQKLIRLKQRQLADDLRKKYRRR